MGSIDKLIQTIQLLYFGWLLTKEKVNELKN